MWRVWAHQDLTDFTLATTELWFLHGYFLLDEEQNHSQEGRGQTILTRVKTSQPQVCVSLYLPASVCSAAQSPDGSKSNLKIKMDTFAGVKFLYHRDVCLCLSRNSCFFLGWWTDKFLHMSSSTSCSRISVFQWITGVLLMVPFYRDLSSSGLRKWHGSTFSILNVFIFSRMRQFWLPLLLPLAHRSFLCDALPAGSSGSCPFRVTQFYLYNRLFLFFLNPPIYLCLFSTFQPLVTCSLTHWSQLCAFFLSQVLWRRMALTGKSGGRLKV